MASSLCLLVGCFREPESVSAPLALRIDDLTGVEVGSVEAPRDLELSLSFTVVPEALEPVLMRGHIDDELVTQLSLARPSAALMEQLLALQIERAPHALRARPTQTLAPGRYSLLWPYGTVPRAYPFSVSPSPALGARLVESAPGVDALNVPPNLARALLRFDGHVQGGLAAHVSLAGAQVSVERCSSMGFPEGDCVWLTPDVPLAPGTHELVIAEGLYTPGGAALAATRIRFQVAAQPDSTPPVLVPTRCAADEQAWSGACVRVDDRALTVRGASDEPVFATLSDGARRVAALTYAGTFELTLRTPAGSTTLRLQDWAGNLVELAVPYTLAHDLATVAIDEVRSDPRGKEPAQEYVELLNFGSESVSLRGYTLSTDAFEKGRTIAAPVVLAPGERVLAVGPDFDPRDTADGPLPSSVRLVPLSGALSVSNRGETLFLRDLHGRRVSAAHVRAPLIEGQCSRRTGEDLRASDAFELDPRGGCTPGTP
ncbi:MAG TPA: lamin tail domain-containing protein [Polyangiales bacterium]